MNTLGLIIRKAVFVSKDSTNMNARVAEEPSLEYGKAQLLSHPSLLKTFGFSAISTYDSYIPSIFGTNTLIWGTLDLRLNFKMFGWATFNYNRYWLILRSFK